VLRYFSLLLLLPAVAVAQTPEVVAKVDAKLDAERSAQRNEDIEILRRLLNKAAGLPDKASVSVTEQPVQRTSSGPDLLRGGNAPVVVQVARSSAAVGPFDGVYLPGAGVVFTLHVPAGVPRTVHGERFGLNSSCSTCHQPQVHVAVPAPAPSLSLANCTTCHSEMPKGEPTLSDWDRVKQDVRGDKSKPAEKPTDDKPRAAVCEPGNLQTLVAGVLAANARHVRHLGEKEGISVVVTFDDVKPVTGYTMRSYYEPVQKVEDGKRTTAYELKTTVEPHTDEPATGYTLSGKPFSPEEVKALSLGDLHLKQNKHKEACDAYGEALARFWAKPFKVSAPTTFTAEQKRQYADELQKGVRDAMKNYAKALLLSDQPDRAKEALDMATGFVVLEVSPISTPAKSTGPAKLILTVGKADIDAAKDAAAFKKAVKVERLNFPEEGKK
jgi:hypothetical protein